MASTADQHHAWQAWKPVFILLGFATASAVWIGQLLGSEDVVTDAARWWIVTVAFSLLVLYLVSGEFSQHSLRVACLVLVGLAAVQLVEIGRAFKLDDTRASIQRSVTDLYATYSTVHNNEQATIARGESVESLRALLGASTAGKEFLSAFATLIQALEAQDADRIATAFDTLSGTVLPAQQTAAEVKIVTAAGSSVDEFNAERRADQLNATKSKLDQACIAASGKPTPDAEKPDSSAGTCEPTGGEVKAGQSLRQMNVALARARLSLAQLSSAISPGLETTALVDTRQKELDAAVAESRESEDRFIAIQAGSDGANKVVRSLTGDRTDLPVALDFLSWIVVLSGLLLLYRWCEIRSARGALGPVEIVAGPEAKVPPEFRHALIENINEPALVPYATALSQLTDLLEAVDPTGRTGKFVRAILNLLGTPSGYRVVYDTETPENDAKSSNDGATDSKVVVFIQILDRRTLRGVAVKKFDPGPQKAAAMAAGYWAAAWIIAQSKEVPSWAQFDPETATALSASQEQQRRSQQQLGQQSSVKSLQKAGAVAPTSGVVLVLLGTSFENSNQYAAALECYLRACIVHPRYPVARYRVGSAFHLIAGDPAKHWWAIDEAMRDSITRQIEQVVPDRPKAVNTLRTGSSLPAIQALQCLAETVLSRTASYATVRWGLVRSFRRSERAYWLGYGRPVRGLRFRSRLRWSCRSVLEASRARSFDHDVESQATGLLYEADHLDSFWLVSYNLACAYALQAARTTEDLSKVASSTSPPAPSELLRNASDMELEASIIQSKISAISRALQPSNVAPGKLELGGTEELASDVRRLCDSAAVLDAQRRVLVDKRISGGFDTRGDSVLKALALLEQSLERYGCEQLSAALMKTDPDLEVLCKEPRFKRLVERLSLESEPAS